MSTAGLLTDVPIWASFLENKELSELKHKQLKSLCKRAKLSAAGGSSALRKRLISFCQDSRPPEWWLEQKLKEEAKAAREVEWPGDGQNVELTVGQELIFFGAWGKCESRTAKVISSSPPSCVIERTTWSQTGRRSGFIGGRTTLKTTFKALAAGTAVVHVYRRKGFGACADKLSEISKITNVFYST